ncbi:MAG TPA: hypothetical protein VKT53_07930 [Candidatus Acidoferrum sp.]|nr:hypothetical protein [Candidatus Acidoferrum sp.]
MTAEESSLNLRDIIRNQPDFVADLGFFVNEGFGGYSGGEHVARKGKKYREQSQFWTFIGEIGKGTVQLYPDAKAYDEMVRTGLGSVSETLLYPQSMALDPSVSFTALGTTDVSGHRCLKIEAARDAQLAKTFLYVAPDLKNLAVASMDVDEHATTTQRLSNISLDVPDSLVEVPSGYKPIEHVRWVRLTSAKLTYDGRPAKDFRVFRAPGGELFIWVDDGRYPWTYICRPDQGIVETEFQGLVVNREGTYIWQTNEAEGFSVIDYRSKSYHPTRNVEASPNSLTFKSISYARDKAMIEVNWK